MTFLSNEQTGMVTTRLRSHLNRWKKFTKNPTVLSLIEEGLKLTFSRPILKRRSLFLKASSEMMKKTLSATIKRFLAEGIIEPTNQKSQILNLFFPILKKNKKDLRWILDLKFVSAHLNHKAYKMETITQIREMIQEKDWMVSIDIVNAFYHLLIHPDYRQYCRFKALNKTYQFKALPMGLSESPWALSRIMNEFIRKIRAKGIRITCYVDDILIMAQTEQECEQHKTMVLREMDCLGITPNLSKSQLIPNQCIEHLGFRLDTEHNRLISTNETRRKLARQAKKILNHPRPQARMIASLLGLLNHASVAAPILKWRSRSIERDLNRTTIVDWNGPIELKESVKDIRAIADTNYLHRMNGCKLTSTWNPSITLTTDASPQGWGATLQTSSGKHQAQMIWTPEERLLTSNQKELLGITRAFFAFKHRLPKNSEILILTDNTSALSYVRGKGKLPTLIEIVRPMINSAFRRRITIRCTHIPGKENTEADQLSRKFPRRDHDWTVSRNAYKKIIQRWGPMGFDLFADWTNSKTPSFASWHQDPRAAIIDSLTHHWLQLPQPWFIAPPWPLLPRVIAKIASLRNQGPFQCVLVAPLWRGSLWFPTLAKIATEFMILPNPTIIPGPSGQHPMRDQLEPEMIAARIIWHQH